MKMMRMVTYILASRCNTAIADLLASYIRPKHSFISIAVPLLDCNGMFQVFFLHRNLTTITVWFISRNVALKIPTFSYNNMAIAECVRVVSAVRC